MNRASWLRGFVRRLQCLPSVGRTRKNPRRKLSRSGRFSPSQLLERLEDRTLLSATFVVNSTADAPDANPGDGIAAAANGKTTLRSAVMEANAENQSSAVQITLPAGNYKLTIPEVAGDAAATGGLEVSSNIQIVGAGAASTTINAEQLDSVFQVLPGASLTLTNVTITGGLSVGASGGGVAVDSGTLILNNDVIASNQVTGSGDDFGGGGVFATNSSVTISGTTFRSNVSSTGSGGDLLTVNSTVSVSSSKFKTNTGGEGGAISDLDGSQMTVDGSTFSGNVSNSNGGGIDVEHATMELTNSTFTSNQAPGDGGGLFNYAATTDLSNDTFKGNTAGGRGGGVENTGRSIFGPAPQGVMTVESSTFTNNSAADGGGIDNKRDSQLTITGSTISSNTASDSGGGVGNSDTEGFGPGTLTISGSTIADNTAANVGGGVLSDQVIPRSKMAPSSRTTRRAKEAESRASTAAT